MFGVWLLYIIGGALRLWLSSTSWANSITSRGEVSTPLNAWKIVEEGVFLHNQDVPVYSGGVFHETPLCLLFGGFLVRSWGAYLPVLFVVLDLMTAALLSAVATSFSRQLLIRQKNEVNSYSTDAEKLLLKSSFLNSSIIYVVAAYLFSPYTIASCVAKTTTVFSNFIIAAALASMLKGQIVLFGICTAIASYQSLYPVCLLVAGALHLAQPHNEDKTQESKTSENLDKTELYAVSCRLLSSFAVTLGVLFVVSAEIAGGWDFLEATYGFILSAPDLTPNIGLFWYFFTEMFEHFRLFFLATFQINAFVYLLPLSIKLRKDPVLLAASLLALTTVFKSYPALGDVGLYLALLPMWRHLYPFMRQTFMVGCMFVATSVLGPIMYNLWIFNGSANANFYFAVTLAFNTAQIFLVTDLLFAHVKREYHLRNGSKMEVDGMPARLMLE
ncbi:phosphatidylinositol glycan anchor biosynthesis class U [Oratosquilla oratoria]|uniref:phosphatidylinositol glycan anchor biosynthesis class U n=1 Tax=Oratosquilla oratoria TaxID=337810 RepID=UPI003F75F15D